MATNIWYTIEYEDESVQTVPHCWIRAKKCYWPSDNTFKTRNI